MLKRGQTAAGRRKKKRRKKNTPQIFHPAAQTTGPTQQAPAVKQDAIFPGMAFLHVNKLPYQHHLPPFDHPGKCAKCLWPPIVWFPGIWYHTAAYYHHTIILLHTTEYFVLRRTDSNFIMTRTEWLPKESEKHDTRFFLHMHNLMRCEVFVGVIGCPSICILTSVPSTLRLQNTKINNK